MAESPSTSAREARRALATRLRELRLDAGLTARALSSAAGWHESKTSRIESAQQGLTDLDIRTWCQLCGSPDIADDLIAASRAVDFAYVDWRRQHRTGLRHTQDARVPLFERTRHMRVYSSTVIPGLFQTPEYATALLSKIAAFRSTPDDVTEAVAARMRRNLILRMGGHGFGVLIEESVLRYRVADRTTMLGQLRHLVSVMGLPSVGFGVLPFATETRPMWPLETFTLFDTARVHVEGLSAQITVTAPGELSLYVRAFEEMSRFAVFGDRARALINSAAEDLR